VAGVPGGVDAETLDGVQDHHAGQEGRQLGVAGLAQFVGVSLEQQVGEVPSGLLGGLLHEFPGRMFPPGGAHAGLLAALARVGEDDHRRVPPTPPPA
jgi:hypothetical protein